VERKVCGKGGGGQLSLLLGHLNGGGGWGVLYDAGSSTKDELGKRL